MKKIISTLSVSLLLVFLVSPVWAVETNTLGDNLADVAEKSGFDPDVTSQSQPLAYVVARFLNIFFGLLGLIFLIITVYAGFRWMTAGGNEEQVGEAKKLLINSVIGLGIIVLSYTITYFVGQALSTVGTSQYPY